MGPDPAEPGLEPDRRPLGLPLPRRPRPLLDPVDLRDIPWRDEHGRTRWAPPTFLPPTDSTERFLISLEEPPLPSPWCRSPCLERRIGGYELPLGAAIIACGNREQDRSIYPRQHLFAQVALALRRAAAARVP